MTINNNLNISRKEEFQEIWCYRGSFCGGNCAGLLSIESTCALSNPFPSKPSIVFSAQKPFYSQPNYFSW